MKIITTIKTHCNKSLNYVCKRLIITTILLLNTIHSSDDIYESSLEDLLNMEIELKANVGSRSGSIDLHDARSPTDVITSEQIEHSGLTSLTDFLRYSVAGFNAPETSIADGSDHVRAFTFRGMSPDQTLILINGKRVHTSALLHVNGTIGRGSSGVDLDTIALKSIDKIEILRDGAAAQYGSDAISGVINIILKGMGHKNSISIHTGQRKKGDGEQLFTDAFISLPLKYDGFVNVTLAAKGQNATDRSGLDKRVSPATSTTDVGIADANSYNAVFNMELPQKNDTIFYAYGLLNHRDSKANAFFRPKDDNENSELLYRDGFLPSINAKIDDYSFSVGMQGEFSGIFYDLSNVYGKNSLNLNVENSMNYTLGASSPTSFDNGTLEVSQNTINLDLKKKFNNIDTAVGTEYRYEDYEIEQGDVNSYIGSASQGFAGYRPENTVYSSRSSYALYFDTTYHMNERLFLEGAARYEDYSDFGTTSNFKVAFGYKILQELLFRATTSTGFRAPSLSQSCYSQTSSFVDTTTGELSTQGTFKPSHEASLSFGAKELMPEESRHFSVGTVYQPTKNLSFMVDYFLTKVDDRITLSEELGAKTQEQIDIFALNNISKIRFFTNAINTKTAGVDIKFNYKCKFNTNSNLEFSAWFNYSKNDILGFNRTKEYKTVLPEQLDRIENGQPKTSLKLLSRYKYDDFDFVLNLNRFGSYQQAINNLAYTFNAEWITDLDISYKFSNGFNLAIGGLNIFNSIPNKWNGLSGTFYGADGIKPYSRYSPFGYSGAYYYVRATVEF